MPVGGQGMRHVSSMFDGHNFDLGRVTVFLGANGTGKSRLLKEIRDKSSGGNPFRGVVYVEGGRTITIEDTIKFNQQTFQRYDRLETSEKFYERKRDKSLADRVFDAIVVLEQKGVAVTSEHSDSVEQWRLAGQIGPCPVRTQPPLERVFEIFNEIFPAIRLRFEVRGRRLIASKDGVDYGPSLLSDGEKQVFSMLVDLLTIEGTHERVIVDEPELNLHPALAEKLWTLIEGEFPDKMFVYATHSIGFALRRGVDAVYVLSRKADAVLRIDDIAMLPRAEMEEFLGGIPGILSASKVIVTEGHEASLDSIFYRWLVGDDSIGIHAAGDCHQVEKIAAKQGAWQKIAHGVRIVGVTDSDFQPSISTKAQASLRLPYHEAESFLCHPELIQRLAERIGCIEQPISAADVETLLFEDLSAARHQIAARRVIADTPITLNLSVKKAILEKVNSESDLFKCILEAGDAEVTRAVDAFGPDKLQEKLRRELAGIDQVIEARDVSGALLLLPGKRLLSKLSKMIGLQHGEAVARAVRANFQAEEFDHLKELRGGLLRSLDS